METIFSKIRTLTLSNIHSILDKAIDMNSIPAMEQHIRDLTAARKDLEGQLAEARYTLTTKTSLMNNHKAKIAELTENATLLANANNGNPTEAQMSSARQMASTIIQLNETLAEDEAAISDAKTMVTGLEDAVSKVTANETLYKSNINKLQSQANAAAAKTKAANAMEAAGNAVQAGGNLDGISDKIGREAARADDAFNRALGNVPSSQPDELSSLKADALLSSLIKPKQTSV